LIEQAYGLPADETNLAGHSTSHKLAGSCRLGPMARHPAAPAARASMMSSRGAVKCSGRLAGVHRIATRGRRVSWRMFRNAPCRHQSGVGRSMRSMTTTGRAAREA
jgi:hypothetical protein